MKLITGKQKIFPGDLVTLSKRGFLKPQLIPQEKPLGIAGQFLSPKTLVEIKDGIWTKAAS